MFKRLMLAFTLVGAIVVASLATPSIAEARHGHRGHRHDCYDGGHRGRSHVSFYYGGYGPRYYDYPAVYVPRSYYGYYGPSYYYPSYYNSGVSFSVGF